MSVWQIVQWQSFEEAISYLQNFLARWSLTSVRNSAARRKKVLKLVLEAFARLLLLRQDSETSSVAIDDTAECGHGMEEETCSSILRRLFTKCGVGKIIKLIGEENEEAALAQ